MFCNKCGKKIEDNAQFCTFCGARMEQLPQDAQGTPAAEDHAETPGAPVITEERPQGSPVNPAAPEESAIPQENAADTAQNAREASGGASQRWSTEVPMSGAAQAPVKSEKPRKYYTGGQMAMCLVTTGIMAMAAGIFAALYFFGL